MEVIVLMLLYFFITLLSAWNAPEYTWNFEMKILYNYALNLLFTLPFATNTAHNNICILITFNNPLKACFSNKRYLITIQICPTQIIRVYFLLKKRFKFFV